MRLLVLGAIVATTLLGCSGAAEKETTKEDFAPKSVPEGFKNSAPGPNPAATPPSTTTGG